MKFSKGETAVVLLILVVAIYFGWQVLRVAL